MTACGQTIAHLPHWMQTSGSQTGISSAMLRFSHAAVPTGKVPSYGQRAHRQAVARADDHRAEDVADELGRGSGHRGPPADGGRDASSPGGADLGEVGERLVDRREVLLDDRSRRAGRRSS